MDSRLHARDPATVVCENIDERRAQRPGEGFSMFKSCVPAIAGLLLTIFACGTHAADA
jgi:hypothetical protein